MDCTHFKEDQNMNSRRLILLLALIFWAPLLIAWTSYFLIEKSHFRTLNYGKLIRPAIAVQGLYLQTQDGATFSTDVFNHKWNLLYLSPKSCAQACQHFLWNIRKAFEMLGKNRYRVRFYGVAPFAHFPGDFSVIPLLRLDQDNQQYLEKKLKRRFSLSREGTLFIIDPLGNMILYYPFAPRAQDLEKDLQRLLSVSQIG